MEIGRHLGEMRVRFTNEVTISESETHHFSGTRLDNNPTREVAAAHVDQPIPDFFGRAAEETFLTRATLWKIFQRRQQEAEGDAARAPRRLGQHLRARRRRRGEGPHRRPPALPRHRHARRRHRAHRAGLPRGAGPGAARAHRRRPDLPLRQGAGRLRRRAHVRQRAPPPRRGQPRCLLQVPAALPHRAAAHHRQLQPGLGRAPTRARAPVSLELVRETKGGDDLDKLRFLNEGRKLVLAERYFATLGIDYRFVSPQVDKYWQSRGGLEAEEDRHRQGSGGRRRRGLRPHGRRHRVLRGAGPGEARARLPRVEEGEAPRPLRREGRRQTR
jgi:hypothetical protein